MDIGELQRLARWYLGQHSELAQRYKALQAPINHNANQPNKQPIEVELNSLVEFLANQKFDELSIEQLKMLTSMGVNTYLGPEGAAYVNGVVRTSDYDPATASQRLSTAMQALNNARNWLNAYAEAVTNLGFGGEDAEATGELITIRVGFQNEVAINNVTDWKDSAKDWYEIIRGLSMACEERPEDVKVIGAATGSIILIMAGTAAFTTLLAQVSKNISSVARDIIGIRVEMENLRQKGLLTRAMATELKKIEKEKADSSVSTIEGLLEEKLKGKDGEIKTALTNSIQKLLTFNEKGGVVDFVSPNTAEEPANEEAVNGNDPESGQRAALLEAQKAIREYQGEREKLKMIADETKGLAS